MGFSTNFYSRSAFLALIVLVPLLPRTISAYPVVQDPSSSSRNVGMAMLVIQSLVLFMHILVFAYEVLTIQSGWRTNSVKFGELLKSSRARRVAIACLPSAWVMMLIVYFVALKTFTHRQRQCDNTNVDPDLAGVGVRTSLYGFGGLIGFMALIGHFHTELLPIAELSLLVWVSLTSTLFNLLKGFLLGMSPSQKVLVAMVLDGYVNCLSIGLAMKETLAYRWRMICSLVLQILGILGIISALSSLKANQVKFGEIEDCVCIKMQWWGSSNTCGRMSITLWVYISLQVTGWFHTAFFAVRNSPHYQRARQAKLGENTLHATSHGTIAESVYDSIPATASSTYIAPLASLLCSCVSLETFLQELGHRDLELWKTWGQSAQIIATTWAGYKVIQEVSRMFSVKSVERRRANLRRCATGTLIPIIGCIEDWNPNGPVWRWMTFHVQQLLKNHPFGSVPPRRPSDHARFCTFDEAWKEMRLDYRQWPTATDEEKGKLLLQASKQGDQNLISDLLEEAAPTDHRDADGKTALRLAIDEGHDSVVALLLAKGADCNIPDVAGTTPLHVCSEMGKKHIVQMLLPAGADVNLSNTVNKWTPLHYACRFGQPEIATLLLMNRADPDAADIKQRTPMHVAIRVGNDGMVDVLAANADMNRRDKKGKTPLYIAARYEREPATVALLRHGADADIADLNRGYTPLHLCARYSRSSIAKILLDHGCNPNMVERIEQKTALHLAANYGREKVVDHLLDANCDMDLLDYKGRTALHFAAKDDRACVRKLLMKGAECAKGDTSFLCTLLVNYGSTTKEAERNIGARHNREILARLNGARP